MTYTQDYDESFALADLEYVGQKYWYDLTWTKTMQPYIKNLQCFVSLRQSDLDRENRSAWFRENRRLRVSL